MISYVYAIISFPLVKKVIDRFSAITDITGIIVCNLLMSYVFPNLGDIEFFGTLADSYIYKSFFCQTVPFISCFWMGGLLAKDNLFGKLKDSLQKNNMLTPVKDLGILGLIVYLRVVAIGQSIDMVYVPFFIICMNDLLLYLKPARKIAIIIGKESTNMWLIHTFFCYYFYPFAKLISATRDVILAWIVLMIISYIASVIVTVFWKNIGRIYRKIVRRFSK